MGKSIAFINETAHWGGGEVVLWTLATQLHKRGWRVIVILPGKGPLSQRLGEANIPTSVIPGAPRFSTSLYWQHSRKIPNPFAFLINLFQGMAWKGKLVLELKKTKPSLVHTASVWAHAWGGLASRSLGIPTVAHIQDLVATSSGKGLYRKVFLKWAVTVPDQIVCISPLIADQFKSIQSNSIPLLIWNAVDTHLYQPDNSNHSLERRVFTIGSAARITEWKGHQTCLQAARDLKNKGIPFIWRFAGDTALGSEEYYQHLQSLVKAWDLANDVIFEGWVKDMPAFYRKIDVLVHVPIEPEPYGLVIAEAMACGLPVIASSGGGSQSLVECAGGSLVPPGDVNQLVRHLEAYAVHPEERKHLGITARQVALKTFNLERTIDQWEQLYTSMIKD